MRQCHAAILIPQPPGLLPGTLAHSSDEIARAFARALYSTLGSRDDRRFKIVIIPIAFAGSADTATWK